MHLVAMAWFYVVGLWALVEATSPNGTWLGALMTLLFYGVLPAAVVLYIVGTPARLAQRRAAASAAEPDRGHHPPGDTVAPERKEP